MYLNPKKHNFVQRHTISESLEDDNRLVPEEHLSGVSLHGINLSTDLKKSYL